MEYQNGQPVLGRAPAQVHDPQLKRISRHEGTVPKISETHILVGCSVGVSLYPGDADDVDALVSHADTAMYQHKASRRGDAVFYKFPIR